MPDGTTGQTYLGTPAVPGKMLKSDDSILNISELLELMLTAMQNVSINIDSVNINTDEVESILSQIRELTIDGNNLLAAIDADTSAMVVDLAAIEVINTAIETAVEIIDNIVGTPGSAFSGDVAVIGGPAESTVPTERADREAVEAWLNTFGQFVNPSHDLATGTDLVTDASPAQMQKQFETGWAALTAPDDLTPTLDVQDYENITFTTVVDIGGNDSVDVIFWGSLDGTNWFQMGDTEQYTADGTWAVTFTGVAIKYIRCEFDDEAGDTDATVTFMVGNGN